VNVRGALGEAAARLAPGDARLLLATALGVTRLDIAVAPERMLSDDEARRFRGLVERRAGGEPASRILGRREFGSLELEIGPAVLDPRPDTETVVEAALDAAGDRGRPLRLLDLGVGSGCILLALLSELPNATGVGLDLSEDAIRVARRNAARLSLTSRAHFVVADWGEPLGGGFDLVVSNPPYIRRAAIADLAPEVARYDPAEALDGGEDGLDAYRRLATGLSALLKPGATAVLEIGLGQAVSVSRLLEGAGLEQCGARADLAGRTRCLIARKR
jgi:release factor glutamine methyltransferase